MATLTAALAHQADAVVRLSGDSPLLDPGLVSAVLLPMAGVQSVSRTCGQAVGMVQSDIGTLACLDVFPKQCDGDSWA